ncbi:hypothetical protein BGZ65_002745, partial [Modicella reniformis]
SMLHTILGSRIQALEDERQVLRGQYQLLTQQSHGDDNGSQDSDNSRTIDHDRHPFTTNNILISQMWKLAEQSTDKFRDLLLDQELYRAGKVGELVQALIQLIPTAEQQIQLAQIHKDEKIRLAEIARDEKSTMVAKEEKERAIEVAYSLAELSQRGKIRLKELEKEICEVQKDEKVKLRELKKDEHVRIAELAHQDKIRLKELEKEICEVQKSAGCEN